MKLHTIFETYRKALVEGLSPVLFHFTNTTALKDILKHNEFLLTADIGTDSEIAQRKKDNFYYMSTTRHKLGGYSLGRSSGAMLVLDGRKLQNNYSGQAVDYYGSDLVDARQRTKSEAEDRIYSKDRSIPKAVKYIDEIHILYGDTLTTIEKRNIRQAYMLAKKHGIPTYFYKDKKSFQTLSKHRAIEFEASELYTSSEMNKIYQRQKSDYLQVWRELYHNIGHPERLSEDGKKTLMAINYDYYVEDEVRRLKADIHNTRREPSVAKLLNIMRKEKLNTVEEFIAFIRKGYHLV